MSNADPAEGRNAVKSADRVLDLFELLAVWNQGMSHSDIAEALKIPKSSLSQLLKNLLARGYVAYLPDSKTYALGLKFGQMARQTSQTRDLIDLAQATLEEVTKLTGESSALNVLHGMSSQVAASADGVQRLLTHMHVGDLAPLHATSGGKAILAFLPEAIREDYLLKAAFPMITPNTLSSAAQVRRQLERIRRELFAEVYEEFTVGIVGFAVPVMSEGRVVLGSINIALPAVRHTTKLKDLAIDTLKNCVSSLENRLAKALVGARKPNSAATDAS